MSQKLLLVLLSALFISCQHETASSLPLLGPYEVRNGERYLRPVEHFQLLNQKGDTILAKDLLGKLQIIDFFFTSCPSICPAVQQQMIRIHEAFPSTEDVSLVSITLDPKRDTPQRLADYANNLGITANPPWQFLTGERSEIFRLVDEYFNIAVLDEYAPGGIDHTGRIVVLDRAGYIRAWTNGVNPQGVDTLLQDIQLLLNDL